MNQSAVGSSPFHKVHQKKSVENDGGSTTDCRYHRVHEDHGEDMDPELEPLHHVNKGQHVQAQTH